MASEVSSFYPPRARWYGPCLTQAARLGHRLGLDRVHLPPGVSPAGFLASLLVPGAAFYLYAPRFWGRIALGSAVVLVLLMVGWFGYPSAAVAFGLLLAIHTSGLAFLLQPSLTAPTFRSKLLLAAGIMVLLAIALYLPARGLVLNHFFLPIRLNGQVIVIHRGTAPNSLRRGDVVAYSFEGFWQGELHVGSGYGLGPILALPGDEVRFSPSNLEVNGQAQPRLAWMPESGVWQVPEKRWFVWPQFAKSGHGYVAAAGIADSIVSLGTISRGQVLGRPCRWWLWRRQN